MTNETKFEEWWNNFHQHPNPEERQFRYLAAEAWLAATSAAQDENKKLREALEGARKRYRTAFASSFTELETLETPYCKALSADSGKRFVEVGHPVIKAMADALEICRITWNDYDEVSVASEMVAKDACEKALAQFKTLPIHQPEQKE